MTKEFDARNAKKSRAVCEAMAERADTGKRKLTERERQILAMWPRFEDGEPVMVGDAVEPPTHGAVSVEAIEFSRGKVCVKDAEDGDWNTSMFAMHPLKRPETKVLDADGVEIHEGEILRGVGRSQHLFKVIDPHHIDPEVGEAFSVRCIDLDDSEWCHCRPELLTHTRPDSWELLEEDAESIRQIIACNFGDFSPSDFKQSGDSLQDRVSGLIRRPKALAGAEAGR